MTWGRAGVLMVVTALLVGTSWESVDRAATGAPPSRAHVASRGASRCPRRPAPGPVAGPSNMAETVFTAADDGVEVALVRYPRPESKGAPWSQWGQGLVLSDGRFVSAMGDHRGPDADSYLFVYDPATRRLTRFADVLSLVDHEPGAWGYGKIHGQIVAGPCGDAYFSTYWGTRSDTMYSSTYRGDVLFRLDARLVPQSLGVPVPEHGVPSLAGFAPKGLVYGEAVDPTLEDSTRHFSDRGAFFVYDVRRRRVVFRSDADAHVGFRNVLVDAKGRAYVAGAGGKLLVWEPGSDELRTADATLPGGGWLRASTHPSPDGTVYGATTEPDEFFALHPDGSVDSLGAARGYTASLALAPDGSRFYYVPAAHGQAWEQGTPVIEVDTTTGKQRVIVELNDVAEKRLGLTLNGSYDIAVDPSGDQLYVGFNAGRDRDDPWGEVVLAIITLSR